MTKHPDESNETQTIPSDSLAPTRAVWSSERVFVLSTAAAGVGLGNLWRFPTLVGSNGTVAMAIGTALILGWRTSGDHLTQQFGLYGLVTTMLLIIIRVAPIVLLILFGAEVVTKLGLLF